MEKLKEYRRKRDQPKAAKPALQKVTVSKAKSQTRAGAGNVAGGALSNPQRVLYPTQGLTKADLAIYYAELAEWIMPYVQNRPLALVRGKEYLIAIIAKDGILRAETLRFLDELRQPRDIGLPELDDAAP